MRATNAGCFVRVLVVWQFQTFGFGFGVLCVLVAVAPTRLIVVQCREHTAVAGTCFSVHVRMHVGCGNLVRYLARSNEPFVPVG